ncbi:MAG: multiprotein-bridging factor 1 family protein [Nitrososphaera sp.]|uniref:helix-turn-helix domain-containing protein n=1 Tax=Nitrososphaera sp. TaxID=1971748 RepID=UPI0018040514|nr:multiprotein-bridging factor 1 family protein [Nitrososphaera sp.]NWG36390.1 TIGR00270 family protein [Nitrososphaera sp.]
MSYCELCGKSAPERKRVIVDGTVFNVCMSCSRHGKPYEPAPVPKKKKVVAPATKKITLADDLVLDPEFPRIIREARMKRGLSHEQLGMQMSEKSNLLRRFETGALKPDELMAKKLERHLGIKLYVSAEGE